MHGRDRLLTIFTIFRVDIATGMQSAPAERSVLRLKLRLSGSAGAAGGVQLTSGQKVLCKVNNHMHAAPFLCPIVLVCT